MRKEADIKNVSHFPNLLVGGETQSCRKAYNNYLPIFTIPAGQGVPHAPKVNRNRVQCQSHLHLKILVPVNNTGLSCRMQTVLLISRENLWSLKCPAHEGHRREEIAHEKNECPPALSKPLWRDELIPSMVFFRGKGENSTGVPKHCDSCQWKGKRVAGKKYQVSVTQSRTSLNQLEKKKKGGGT